MISSKDGIIGLAIGDALGVPVEFSIRAKLQMNPISNMIGYGSHHVPAGSWSDDTSMTLATMDAIIKKKYVDSNAIGDCFVDWYKNEKYNAIDKVFDIGRTCLRAIAKYELGTEDAEKCGCTDIMDNGNGSLMRILPIAYYCYFSKLSGEENFETVYELVKKVSSITHGHEISIMACFIYVLFAMYVLQGHQINEAYEMIQSIDYHKWFSDETISKYDRILKTNIKDYDISEIKSSGYVVDTLEATFWSLFNTDNYNDAVIKAINLGEDTDTIGACTGGLAGIVYGIDSIKPEWKNSILKYDYIIQMCEDFDKVRDI